MFLRRLSYGFSTTQTTTRSEHTDPIERPQRRKRLKEELPTGLAAIGWRQANGSSRVAFTDRLFSAPSGGIVVLGYLQQSNRMRPSCLHPERRVLLRSSRMR